MDQILRAVDRAERSFERWQDSFQHKLSTYAHRALYEMPAHKNYRLKVEGLFQEYVDGLNKITPYDAIQEEVLRQVKALTDHDFDSFDSLDKVISQDDASKAERLKRLDESLIEKLRQLRKDYQESFPSSRAQFVNDTDRIILDYIFDKRGDFLSKGDLYYFSISNKFSFINYSQLVESCRSPLEVAYTFRPEIVWLGVDENFLQFYKKYKDEKFVNALFLQFEKAYREQGGAYFDGDIGG